MCTTTVGSNSNFSKIYFIFFKLCVCALSEYSELRKVLEFQVLGNSLTQVLGTKLESSVRSVQILNL